MDISLKNIPVTELCPLQSYKSLLSVTAHLTQIITAIYLFLFTLYKTSLTHYDTNKITADFNLRAQIKSSVSVPVFTDVCCVKRSLNLLTLHVFYLLFYWYVHISGFIFLHFYLSKLRSYFILGMTLY